MRFKYLLLVLTGICSLQFPLQDAESCSVPVFRYALERWKPDPYKGIFLYRGEITESDRVLLQQLEQAAQYAEDPLNLWIQEVDRETFSENKLKELFQDRIPDDLPVLAIWFPEQMGKAAPLWTLKLTSTSVKALTRSPKRQQLAESLIDGGSVVWIFVPSGNVDKDEQAMTLIEEELDSALIAFERMPYYFLSGSGPKKLTYGFPILTLSRTDPEELFFLDMLLKSESDLHEYKDEPMVFPIYGRARLLGCLFGEYITREKIQNVVSFLGGSCSCEVKALNPGLDLLVSAPWDLVVMHSYIDDTPLPELTGVMPEVPDSIEQPAIEQTPPDNNKKNMSIFATYGIALSAVVVIVGFASLILNQRRKKV